MYLHLDHHSGEPIYRQIVEAIKYRVASGRLAPGDLLPSIRALAQELKINPGTVVKAYEDLCHSGVVVMRHGQGVFVATRRDLVPDAVRREAIADMTRRMLAEALRMGATAGEVREIVEQVSEEMAGSRV